MSYVALSYASEFNGQSVSLGSASVDVETASNLLGAQAGATLLVGSRAAVFASAGLTEGLDRDISGYHGQGGFKFYW